MKNEIIERLITKEIRSKILDEVKVLEEIKTKLRKLKTKIIKNWFWDETDEQETLERLEREIEK